MAWFRRKAPSGRHALGAAVTSIPSGPPSAAPSVPVALPPPLVPDLPPTTSRLTPFSGDLLGSVAELVATGGAWGDGSPRAEPGPAPAAAVPPSARSSLEQALAQLRPPQSAPVPQQLRVQLGFRDGTSTTLDPGSTQALALEELAQSLTRRD